MAIESTSSMDVFIEADPDGDKLVIRNKSGSVWFKITCDDSGNLIITGNDSQVTQITTTTRTI